MICMLHHASDHQRKATWAIKTKTRLKGMPQVTIAKSGLLISSWQFDDKCIDHA